MTRPILALVLLSILAVFAPGCANLGYYLRAGEGQTELQELARPIPEVLADPSTPGWLRSKLDAAVQIRDFATRELHLPEGAGYRSYADLGRPYVVWNVFAAPEFSTTLKEWCFPVAGCVGYRGYFSEEAADALAATLRGEGYDTYVSGVPAYSTLGWFDDPILNTFIRYPDRELAKLIFHELAHRLVYVKDDSTFNESFATTVELEGVRRWLSAGGRAAEISALELSEERGRDFRRFLAAWRRRLGEVYGAEAGAEPMRERKRRALDELRASYQELKNAWGGYAGYDAWFARDVNNARLASVSTYTELVPAFSGLLRQVDGDLLRFYEEVRKLADKPKDARLIILEGFVPRSAPVLAERVRNPRSEETR